MQQYKLRNIQIFYHMSQVSLIIITKILKLFINKFKHGTAIELGCDLFQI